MRCVPQVHGAARERLAYVRQRRRRREPTPPPTTRWSSPRTARSCRAATSTARRSRWPPTSWRIAVAQLATISERRTERLVNPALSGLPAFLTRHGGLQSGLMMAQVTAAALVSENKTLAHPASVDTIPTSANQEDHVSMSMARGAQGRARRCSSPPTCWPSSCCAPARRSTCWRRWSRRHRSCKCMRALRSVRAGAHRRPAAGARPRARRRAHRRRRARVRVRRRCQLISISGFRNSIDKRASRL